MQECAQTLTWPGAFAVAVVAIAAAYVIATFIKE